MGTFKGSRPNQPLHLSDGQGSEGRSFAAPIHHVRLGDLLRQHGQRFIRGLIVRFDQFVMAAIQAVVLSLESLKWPTAADRGFDCGV